MKTMNKAMIDLIVELAKANVEFTIDSNPAQTNFQLYVNGNLVMEAQAVEVNNP